MKDLWESKRRLLLLASFLGVFAACAAPTDTPKNTETYDTVPPHITEWMPQPAILVFSATKGWRHNEGIAGADLFFTELASEHRYGLFTTVNSAVFNSDDLSRFDVVVFNNMTGDTLSPEQEKAFQLWFEAGGAWIGLHSAGDDTHQAWEWYQNTLIGPLFIGHPMRPQFSPAKLVSLNKSHPIMEGMPEEWRHLDEWYSFNSTPQAHNMTPLIGLDETSIWPTEDAYLEDSEMRMGDTPAKHPIIWTNCAKAGRSFYSAIGHMHTSYEDETYRLLLNNAFDWVTKQTDPDGDACP